MWNATRTFKRYYHVSRYLRSRLQSAWIDTNASVPIAGALNLPNAPYTTIRVACHNFNPGDRIGTVKVTYYVKYRY